MNHLPDDVLKIIWEFDDTYRKEYKKCMDQIEKSRELHNEINDGLLRRGEINIFQLHDKYTYLNFIFHEYLRRQSYYSMSWLDRMLSFDRRIIVPCPDL